MEFGAPRPNLGKIGLRSPSKSMYSAMRLWVYCVQLYLPISYLYAHASARADDEDLAGSHSAYLQR